MRLPVEVKIRKAIRRGEHNLPGLQAAIAQHTPQDATTVKALCRLVLDPAEKRDRRSFVFNLLWQTSGAEDACLAMLTWLAGS